MMTVVHWEMVNWEMKERLKKLIVKAEVVGGDENGRF